MKNKKKIVFVKNKTNAKENDKTTTEIKTDSNEIIYIDSHNNIQRLVNSYNWLIPPNGYPVTREKTTDIRMHQLIIKNCFGNEYVPTKDTNKVIDHLNNDPCDNRLRNLHILPVRDNNNKKTLDLNFDNLTVYIEYEYDFDYMLTQQQVYTLEEIQNIYDNRKYVLSYVATDILLAKDTNGQIQYFNCFELIYNDYQKFIKDIKQISKKTKEMNRIIKLSKKNPLHKDLKSIKGIQDIKLNSQKLEKQRQAIEGILNNRAWLEIRNITCNMLTKEEFNKLSEHEQQFYKTLNATVYQWLPPSIQE